MTATKFFVTIGLKRGGGVLAYLSSRFPSKKLKLPRTFTTLEALVIESKFGKHNVVIMGLYRPPKAAGMDYYLRLENDLNDIVTWATSQKQFVIMTGDLNLNRLKPDKREGKILRDLEDIHELSCLINKPTINIKNNRHKSNVNRCHFD